MSNASSGFQHMARMMDSLILDNFSPYSFTKITTTHRPQRMATSVKKTTTTGTSNNVNANNMIPQSATGIRLNIQKNKIPMQGMN